MVDSELRATVAAKPGAVRRLAGLELVAVFDDDDRRVPIYLGRDDAA